jgi:hypothetical protein
VTDPTPGPSSRSSETVSFAADLDVRGRHVVVCGGGPGAYGPISALVAAGARLTVYDREPGTTVRDLAERGLLSLRDAESGAEVVIDTEDRRERERYAGAATEAVAARRRLLAGLGVDELQLRTDRSYIQPLMAYFRARAGKRRLSA